MFHSASLHLVEFDGLKSFGFLIGLAQKEVPIHIQSGAVGMPGLKGTIITSQEQLDEIRSHVQELRKYYKSEISKCNVNKYSITELFVPTRFDEDGWDGEEWHGVELQIEYHWIKEVEFVVVNCRDKIVTENPYLGRS